MAPLTISAAQSSDMTNNVTNFSVDPKNTDGLKNQDETWWLNPYWTQWYGYYRQIPELKKAIDMKAIWTVGKGYVADPRVTSILDGITGNGRDTFNSILKNMVIICQINGDSFAEIIRDPDTGELVNLKCLDPGSIRIVYDKKGIIKRYDQINKIPGGNKIVQEFTPTEIFHLSRDRVADEIHGISVVEACEKVILMRNESMDDMKKLMHRHVKPILIFHVDSDDENQIRAYATKMDSIVNLGENLYVPKDTVKPEVLAVPSNATLNPLPWLSELSSFFFQAVGIPRIILGGSQEFTESTAKIAYLAFEQSVEDDQMFLESQLWQQLGLRIELEFPASLRNELLNDEAKDGEQGQINFQPNETTAGVGR